jgi:hypothetical protein
LELVNVMETKSFKLLKNVKISWISMFCFAKRVMAKYMLVLIKMGLDMATKFQVVTRLWVLGWFGCSTIHVLFHWFLEELHALIKYFRSNEIFVNHSCMHSFSILPQNFKWTHSKNTILFWIVLRNPWPYNGNKC